MHEISQRNCKSEEVSKSENFEKVVWVLFFEENQTWDCSKEIKNEVA